MMMSRKKFLMPFRNKFRNKIEDAIKKSLQYKSALFHLSGAEASLLLPVPFLKIGLSNAVVVKAVRSSMPLLPLIFLSLEKAVSSAIFSLLLATPFFLLSLSQSLFSALVMFLVQKAAGKKTSAFGLSVAGAASSALCQLALCSLYLGRAVFSLLSPMLVFSLFSGAITAAVSEKISAEESGDDGRKVVFSKKSVLLFLCAVLFCVLSMREKNIFVLVSIFSLCVLSSLFLRVKTKLLPFFSIGAFCALSAIFSPSGRVIFTLFSLKITSLSLLEALKKTLSLFSCVLFSKIALSLSQK